MPVHSPDPAVARPGGGARDSVSDAVERLASLPSRAGRLTHLERLPARSGRPAPWPGWADTEVVAALG